MTSIASVIFYDNLNRKAMKILPNSLSNVYTYPIGENASQNKNIENEMAMSELRKIYWHEKELLIALPFLLKTACTFELVESLTMLGQYTKEHIRELETIFPSIDQVA